MGGRTMDQAEENDWSGIFRGWEAQLWATDMHRYCRINCTGYLQGHNTSF